MAELKAEVIEMRVKQIRHQEPTVKHDINLLVVRYWMKFDGLKSNDAISSILGLTPMDRIIKANHDVIRSERNFVKGDAKTLGGGQGFLDLDLGI